jgi:hypothetical protein
VWHALHDDWLAKTRQIHDVEQELAEILVKTPYILLLSHPGIGVLSAAELAGEMGPIEYYAHKCNNYFHGKFLLWKKQGVDSRDIRCRVANRATRTVFQMVSGRQLYRHPSRLDRGYVLDKLLAFFREHDTPPHEILRDLRQAAEQIPRRDYATEAVPLQGVCSRGRRSRKPGPRAIGDILVSVLARLGVDETSLDGRKVPRGLECETEAPKPDAKASDTGTR